jgi:NAD(P)-dependent dehydrogenase (short-subunit alcohol dehydrogenase family)
LAVKDSDLLQEDKMPKQTALITGASKGLGKALAEELARQGCDLIITARGEALLSDVTAELRAHAHVISLSGDINDPNHRAKVVDAAIFQGGIDVVINNAGTLGTSPLPTLMEYPIDEFRQVLETNVIAPLTLLQQLNGWLNAGARIVNITSDAAVEAYETWGGYGSSKAAFEHLTAILGEERKDLRVYAVDPGDVRTDMHQAAFPFEDFSDRPKPESSVPGIIALIERRLPSGRYKAREVEADAVHAD